jgi:hypothetical protein
VTEEQTMVDTEPQETEGTPSFNVMLRMVGGERLEAGSFASDGEAHAFAGELIAAAMTGGQTWPRVGDRYLRPETIVSIDVEPDAHPRWTGSTGRANSWTGRPGE